MLVVAERASRCGGGHRPETGADPAATEFAAGSGDVAHVPMRPSSPFVRMADGIAVQGRQHPTSDLADRFELPIRELPDLLAE